MADDSPLSKPTAGAQRALGLAHIVNKVFANERVPSTLAGHAGYRVEMSGPNALSTSSRKGAIDHLQLVPTGAERKPGEGGGATIVIGTADPSLSQVELRTYEDLRRLHGERFKGEALPIESAAYLALREKIEVFFERQGIATISSATPSELTKRPGSVPPRKGSLWMFFVAGFVVALGLIVLVLRSR